MRETVVLLHNIRSTYNVGSILRSCEGFGIKRVIISGYTPYPVLPDDNRLPHISRRLTDDIHKTALGAEVMIEINRFDDPPLEALHGEGYVIIGVEQDETSSPLPSFPFPGKVALLLGEEVGGIQESLRRACEHLVEIPMFGHKESFNVSVAAGIALYHLSCIETQLSG